MPIVGPLHNQGYTFRATLIKFGALPGMKPLSTACRLPGMNHAVYSVKRKQVPGESVSRNSYQMQGQAIKARNGETETKQ